MLFQEQVRRELDQLEALGRLRSLREVELDGAFLTSGGDRLVNLTSNDYLGIAADRRLRREFFATFDGAEPPAMGAAASRLLAGGTHEIFELERELGELYGRRSALVFNSGYHANTGILPALAGKGDLILADKLVHASIIDALKLGDAEFRRYRHLDYEQLGNLLADHAGKYRQIFLVTESLFSMDGDWADLRILAKLRREFGAVLIVDEAHAVGVCGPGGLGFAAELGLSDEIDVLIGTFGKAFGSVGAYAICGGEVRELLVNRMRPLIFSTALPPFAIAWTRFVLAKVRAMEPERRHLAALGVRLREIMAGKGLAVLGESQIVPLVAGEDAAALALSDRLARRGFLALAVRPPTVPVGGSRLRFSLSSALTEEMIERLGECL